MIMNTKSSKRLLSSCSFVSLKTVFVGFQLFFYVNNCDNSASFFSVKNGLIILLFLQEGQEKTFYEFVIASKTKLFIVYYYGNHELGKVSEWQTDVLVFIYMGDTYYYY